MEPCFKADFRPASVSLLSLYVSAQARYTEPVFKIVGGATLHTPRIPGIPEKKRAFIACISG